MQQPRNPWLRYSRLLSAELPYDKRQEVWRDDFSAIMPWAPFYYGAIKKWIGSGTQQEEAVIHAIVRDLNGIFGETIRTETKSSVRGIHPAWWLIRI